MVHANKRWWERLASTKPDNTVICPECQATYLNRIVSATGISLDELLAWSEDYSDFLSQPEYYEAAAIRVFSATDIAVLETISVLNAKGKSHLEIVRALSEGRRYCLSDLPGVDAPTDKEGANKDTPGWQHSSIDVVCPNDDTVLAGLNLDRKTKMIIAHGLRALLVVTAIAVGFFDWAWSVYIYAGLVSVAFLGMFFRRHRTQLRFFFVASAVAFAGLALWIGFGTEFFSYVEVSTLILFLLSIPMPVFLSVYTFNSIDDGAGPWIQRTGARSLHTGTLFLVAFMLTLAALCFFATLIISLVSPLSDLGTMQFLPRLGLLIFAAGEVTALVASMIYTLRGEPFEIPDRWAFENLVDRRDFGRLGRPVDRLPTQWKGRFGKTLSQLSRIAIRVSNILRRTAVSSLNALIGALESSYNRFLVGFINGMASYAVKIANTLRKCAIKTVRHLVRSVKRFLHLNSWSIRWALHVNYHYSKVFIAFPLLIWLTAAVLFNTSQVLDEYIHGGHFLLPVRILAQILVVLMLATLGTKQLLLVKLGTYGEKVLNALGIFGINAFLTFLLTAWLLGLVGSLFGQGPYRVGWVTILSTILIVVTFWATQRQTKDIAALRPA